MIQRIPLSPQLLFSGCRHHPLVIGVDGFANHLRSGLASDALHSPDLTPGLEVATVDVNRFKHADDGSIVGSDCDRPKIALGTLGRTLRPELLNSGRASFKISEMRFPASRAEAGRQSAVAFSQRAEPKTARDIRCVYRAERRIRRIVGHWSWKKLRCAPSLHSKSREESRICLRHSLRFSGGMPEISRFYGIVIRMFWEHGAQHHLPHFHAYYQESKATFAIDSLVILRGALPTPQRRLVEAWAEIHRTELIANWELLNSSQPPFKIDPLV